MTRGFLNQALNELQNQRGTSLPENQNNLSLLNLPNDNIKVESFHPVITARSPNEFQIFQWGFVLFWMDGSNVANYSINAAIETVFEKPAFQEAVKHRRCIIPFSGFYESRIEGNEVKKYLIERKDKEVFFVAGIWDQFREPGGNLINSFLPLTYEANEFIAPYNKRMPFVLYPEFEDLWLDKSYNTESLLEMIEPIYTDDFEINLVG